MGDRYGRGSGRGGVARCLMVVGVCAVGVSGVVVGQSGVVGASRVGVAGPVVPVPPVVPGVVPIAVAPSFAKSLARPVPLPPAVDTTVQAVQGSRVVVSGLPVSVELLSAPPVGAKSVAVKVRSFDPKVLPQVGLQGVGMEFDAAGVGVNVTRNPGHGVMPDSVVRGRGAIGQRTRLG